jgi:hypothetical protein
MNGTKQAASSSTTSAKISGRTYRLDSCSKTKTTAQKQAEAIRAKGKTARVKKTQSGYCVYVGPAKRTKKRRA